MEQGFKDLHKFYFDENNLITLCSSCHSFGFISAHKNSIAFGNIFANKFPDRYNWVIQTTAKELACI